jgi:hypothetical protein
MPVDWKVFGFRKRQSAAPLPQSRPATDLGY